MDDVYIIKYILNNNKWDTIETNFEFNTYKHENSNIGYADLNIHLDLISPLALNMSDFNIFIPDLEMFNENQKDYLCKINLILYKFHEDRQILSNLINKNVEIKYLGWTTPERLTESKEFVPKKVIELYTIMHEENKNEVITLAKSWIYSQKLKIYTYLKSDDCLLDLIGLFNIEILFDFKNMFKNNSCYIQIGRISPNIILENMCYGNVVFYRDDIDHEYLSTTHGFVDYNQDNLFKKLIKLNIEYNSELIRKKHLSLTIDFIKNFKKIFNNIFSTLEPFEPILNELPDNLPIISLISRDKNKLLEKWYNNLDYPKDKLEWKIDENIDLLINESKGDFIMMFDKNFYYHPQCINNRIVMIRDKECVYCATQPNYNYHQKISSIFVEPITKKYKDRILESSLFFKKQFWKNDCEFNKIIEINWLGILIGINTNLNINAEPNGCHFNIEGGMDLDIIDFLNSYRYE